MASGVQLAVPGYRIRRKRAAEELPVTWTADDLALIEN
jgi:hypothetical protein